MSNSLWPHGLQRDRLPYPSVSPGVCSNSCPLNCVQRCYPAISSSVTPFSSCPKSFPASGSFPVSWFFTSGGQSSRASASVLPINIQCWFPLGLIDLISLLSKGLSRVFQHHKNSNVKVTGGRPVLQHEGSQEGNHTRLLQQGCVVLVTQSCLTLCDPMDCSPPGNSPCKDTRIRSHFPSLGDIPKPGIEPRSPTLQADSLLSEPPRKPSKGNSSQTRNFWNFSPLIFLLVYLKLCSSSRNSCNFLFPHTQRWEQYKLLTFLAHPLSCHLKERTKAEGIQGSPFPPHFSQYSQKQSGEPVSQLSWVGSVILKFHKVAFTCHNRPSAQLLFHTMYKWLCIHSSTKCSSFSASSSFFFPPKEVFLPYFDESGWASESHFWHYLGKRSQDHSGVSWFRSKTHNSGCSHTPSYDYYSKRKQSKISK